MGQYYKIVNINKKEYMSPSDFGAGLKLMEFAYPMGPSTVTAALAILLADGNNRGGGDLRSDYPVFGSWKYDRVAVVGDYADEHEIFGQVYQTASEFQWRNVSEDVLVAMVADHYFAQDYASLLRGQINNPRWWPPKLVVNMAHRYEDPQDANAKVFFENLFLEEGEREDIVRSVRDRFEFRN